MLIKIIESSGFEHAPCLESRMTLALNIFGFAKCPKFSIRELSTDPGRAAMGPLVKCAHSTCR